MTLQPICENNAKDRPLSVSELTLSIKEMLEGMFPEFWVRGELSNVRVPGSGHIYATLKDQDTQIKCVMFRHQASRLAPDFKWQDGIEVIVKGKLSVYGPQGSYQIIASAAEQVGHGALQAEFEARKRRLSEKGWFDKQTPLPKLPRCVGVVTSLKAAALADFLNIVSRRFPTLPIEIYPASVQGKDAPEDLISALSTAQRLKHVDVIVMTRGGGSIEDLWCFNDETLAETIFQCDIPVVSAVGHEIDFTICDFVADLRAPTPSAAAECVVPVYEELSDDLRQSRHRLDDLFTGRLASEKKHLESLFHQLVHPRHRIELQKQVLEHKLHELHGAMGDLIQLEKNKIQRLLEALEALNPKAVLERGYALVSRVKGQQIVTQAKGVKLKERLNVTFSDGPIVVSVDDVLLL